MPDVWISCKIIHCFVVVEWYLAIVEYEVLYCIYPLPLSCCCIWDFGQRQNTVVVGDRSDLICEPVYEAENSFDFFCYCLHCFKLKTFWDTPVTLSPCCQSIFVCSLDFCTCGYYTIWHFYMIYNCDASWAALAWYALALYSVVFLPKPCCCCML